MKGCILLQNNVVKLAHAMAVELKNKYGVEEFCGYVYSRFAWDFIQKQKDFKYSALLLDQELHKQALKEKLDIEYIKKLEKQYGIPNLWPFIDVDRTLMMSIPPKQYTGKVYDPICSHENMLKHLQVRAKAIIKTLTEEKPDFIVFTAIGSIGHLILYHVAKKMGIKTFIIDLVRTKNRVTFTEDYNGWPSVEKIFEKLRFGQIKSSKREEAKKLLEDIRKTRSLSLPYTEGELTYQKSFSSLSSVAYLIKMTVAYFRNPHRKDYSEEDPWNFFKYRVLNKLRKLRSLESLYDEPDWNEDFAFFPLHLEPEVSMSLIAEFYRDQINLIRQIARSLPVHFKLYVKEHPTMEIYRPKSYYRELKRIPNVKLIKESAKSIELIEKSKLVVVITSSAGWEAVILKKPVISFGNIFYNKLSFVKKSTEIEKLPSLIKEQLENFKYDEGELIDFLSAILEDSVDLNYLQLGSQAWVKNSISDVTVIKEDAGFKNFTRLLAKKLNLIK